MKQIIFAGVVDPRKFISSLKTIQISYVCATRLFYETAERSRENTVAKNCENFILEARESNSAIRQRMARRTTDRSNDETNSDQAKIYETYVSLYECTRRVLDESEYIVHVNTILDVIFDRPYESDLNAILTRGVDDNGEQIPEFVETIVIVKESVSQTITDREIKIDDTYRRVYPNVRIRYLYINDAGDAPFYQRLLRKFCDYRHCPVTGNHLFDSKFKPTQRTLVAQSRPPLVKLTAAAAERIRSNKRFDQIVPHITLLHDRLKCYGCGLNIRSSKHVCRVSAVQRFLGSPHGWIDVAQFKYFYAKVFHQNLHQFYSYAQRRTIAASASDTYQIHVRKAYCFDVVCTPNFNVVRSRISSDIAYLKFSFYFGVAYEPENILKQSPVFVRYSFNDKKIFESATV